LPLQNLNISLGAAPNAILVPWIASTLAEAGATILTELSISDAAEAYARPVRSDNALEQRTHALVFDASAIQTPAELRALFDFFQPRLARLSRSGRIVVLGRPDQTATLSGFVRSVAKEMGRKGTTANLIIAEPGAESRIGPVLRWLLDKASAFVTAQPVLVTTVARTTAEEAAYVRPLDGKVALVTGAARGIGRATATALANEGAFVWCVDRPEDGEETSRVARKIGGFPLLLDVTARNAVAEIREALVDKGGGLDILVHNAGVTRDKTLARMKPDAWDLVMAVNLEAVVRITEGLVEDIREGGRILCVSSVSGIAGNVGQTHYATSKAALMGYVDTLAKTPQLAERGITANAVAPGFIETRMTSAIPLVIRQGGRLLSALSQGGEPEDVAALITFLASPGAQGITGRTVRVCGGALIGA